MTESLRNKSLRFSVARWWAMHHERCLAYERTAAKLEVPRVTGLGPQPAALTYSAAMPLNPAAAGNPGICVTSSRVPSGRTAKTPTVPTSPFSE